MGASTPPGVGTGLAYNSIGLGRSLAQPVAIQAPAGGAALLTATMASITGGAGPLSFLLGIVCGVFLVLIFAELARPFGSAGAVYAYAGLMAGVNFAFVIGWIYVLMMMALWSGTLSATADFFNSTLSTVSAAAHVPWVLISIVVCGPRGRPSSTRNSEPGWPPPSWSAPAPPPRSRPARRPPSPPAVTRALRPARTRSPSPPCGVPPPRPCSDAAMASVTWGRNMARTGCWTARTRWYR